MLKNEKYSKAEKIYSELITYNNSDSSLLHFAGIAKYKIGKYEEALNLLDRSISASPNYAEAFNSKGIILYQQKKYEDSRLCFEAAVNLNPNYDNAYLNLGNTYYELGEIDDAIRSYKNSLEFNKHNVEAAYKLAGLCLTINDANSALEYANYSLQINSHCQHALAYKAIANWYKGDQAGWEKLYNFEEMIYQVTLNTPLGYKSIDEFNDALANDIYKHKSLIWEPLERVTNGGAVTSDLLTQPTRSMKTLEKSISKIVNNLKMSVADNNEDSILKQIPNNYKMTLIGSILKESGVHPPHVHENSLLSGVYYVDMPDFVSKDDTNHLGWLEFGRPDVNIKNDINLPLTARYPEMGTILIFPSYFFHGTIPFEKNGKRIGIAFDLYPVS
ncbi:MAG: putative 2OG-Fe(II) oxygenase [Pseudomonadota bacterium]